MNVLLTGVEEHAHLFDASNGTGPSWLFVLLMAASAGAVTFFS